MTRECQPSDSTALTVSAVFLAQTGQIWGRQLARSTALGLVARRLKRLRPVPGTQLASSLSTS